MFILQKSSVDLYRLKLETTGIDIGRFELSRGVWSYEFSTRIYQDTNPNIFPFILKTLENLNNGVVYE